MAGAKVKKKKQVKPVFTGPIHSGVLTDGVWYCWKCDSPDIDYNTLAYGMHGNDYFWFEHKCMDCGARVKTFTDASFNRVDPTAKRGNVRLNTGTRFRKLVAHRKKAAVMDFLEDDDASDTNEGY